MWLTRWLGHPSRVIPAAYLAAIAVGTALLMIPGATTAEGSPELMHAVFTAVSAICITGLSTVDTVTELAGRGVGLDVGRPSGCWIADGPHRVVGAGVRLGDVAGRGSRAEPW